MEFSQEISTTKFKLFDMAKNRFSCFSKPSNLTDGQLRPQLCEGDMVLVDGSEALAILTEKEVNNNKKGLTRMPWLSSETWMSLRPPSLTTTLMEEERASRLFSTSSLTAETGRWMTSSAAIRFTRDSSRR
ncbi:uncharacterized protein LOC103955195 isoform X4 [Pyrus x bretschneideri]|uniref:uncharacterized protein LOC103955195 isoform X4 n=1 Tax=Pyrus x bretschneideri TaxID=225117 RepID=UPI00202E941A|nr:uncharacterized protein LOC103955195 isoform X4 [Pyrus x bretschneideri]XP_048424027.1 uncharacterized protein LOC103955195 isoform X4 [Pyrus x bretschneideri]